MATQKQIRYAQYLIERDDEGECRWAHLAPHMGLNSNPLNVGRELEKMSVEQCSHTIQVLLE